MIIVTGGAGFIGSNLVAALEEAGHGEIVVCDHLGSEDKWRNLRKHEVADLIEPNHLLPYLEHHQSEVDALLHMGAISATTETDVDLIARTNVRLPLELWHWCTEAEVPFIYASSGATYGDGSQGFDDDPSFEALAQLRPLNPYGWSKHLFDRRALRMAAAGGAPPQWVGLKFFNVYGPNEYHKGGMKSVVAHAYPAAAAGKAVQLFRSHRPDYPDGGQMRDFVSVHDCSAVVLWLLENPGVSGLFNVGTGGARTFNDLVEALFGALGRESEIEFVDTPIEIRDKYQYFTEARMERLRAAGYDRPFLTLEEGVMDYVQNYLATEDPYR